LLLLLFGDNLNTGVGPTGPHSTASASCAQSPGKAAPFHQHGSKISLLEHVRTTVINLLNHNFWMNQNFHRHRQFDLEEEVLVVMRLAVKVCLQ